jgi:integrase
MAQITKTKTGYRVRAAGVWRERPDGTRYRDRKVIASGIPTLREAKAIAAKETSPDYVPPHAMTCADQRAAYVQAKTDAGRSVAHTRNIESELRNWWHAFDHVPLQGLAPEHLEDMKRALQAKRVRRHGEMVPLSHNQQSKVWKTTVACLSHAVRTRKITWNPADACDPPAAPSRPDADELAWWEPATVAEFLALADPEKANDDVEHMLRTAVCLNFSLGLRPGELAALRWSDRVSGVVKIRRSRSMVGGRKDIVEKAPKTKNGRRDVAVSVVADRLMRCLQSRQVVTSIDGYCFSIDGDPVHPANIIDCFQRLQREFLADRPGLRRLTFYGSRHSAITGWIRAGIDTPTVSRMAGHSSFAFTVDHYREVLESDLTDAAAKMAGLFR